MKSLTQQKGKTMIIKCNLTGIPSIRLKVSGKLTQQLHVTRKTDKYGRRIATSWITGTTEVTIERYHSNKNSKDIDGLIYVGRSFQQYMDKFDETFGYRLAGVRAFTKFFQTNGKDLENATKLAEYIMDAVIANKGKESIVVSGFGKTDKASTEKKVVAAVATPAKATKRGRPAKAAKASSAKASAAPKKRGRPAKNAAPVQAKRRRGRPRKMPS